MAEAGEVPLTPTDTCRLAVSQQSISVSQPANSHVTYCSLTAPPVPLTDVDVAPVPQPSAVSREHGSAELGGAA